MYNVCIYMYQCRHSLVPVVPESLLEMVQLPSIYIMGMHSSLRNGVEELVSVREVGMGKRGKKEGRKEEKRVVV